MQVLTRKQEGLVQRLVELAGSPVVLQIALEELGDEDNRAGLETLVRRVIEVRDRDVRHPNVA